MKKILGILAILITACGPARLQTDTGNSADEVDTTIGFLENSDCGWDLGENACDFQLQDQDEDLWRLSNNQGDLILLDFSVMWCGPCNNAAVSVQNTHDKYEKYGFQYVTVLLADAQNDTVEQEDIDSWTSAFSITTAPVLTGDRNMIGSTYNTHGFPIQSWPTFVLIDREGNVVYGLRGFNESWLVQEIEANL
tara:strand:- start:384 stop:965 length:582 start_codon:yes stop_codon:yes gene_type:complete